MGLFLPESLKAAIVLQVVSAVLAKPLVSELQNWPKGLKQFTIGRCGDRQGSQAGKFRIVQQAAVHQWFEVDEIRLPANAEKH